MLFGQPNVVGIHRVALGLERGDRVAGDPPFVSM
jgi:hypothetical protein